MFFLHRFFSGQFNCIKASVCTLCSSKSFYKTLPSNVLPLSLTEDMGISWYQDANTEEHKVNIYLKFPFFLWRYLFPSLLFPHSCKGKGRVKEFGRCSSISCSLGFKPLCACKACCTSTNKAAIHFFDKSCTGVLGSVNWRLICCLENYSLLIYITWRQPQIYSGLNRRENAKVSVILI